MAEPTLNERVLAALVNVTNVARQGRYDVSGSQADELAQVLRQAVLTAQNLQAIVEAEKENSNDE